MATPFKGKRPWVKKEKKKKNIYIYIISLIGVSLGNLKRIRKISTSAYTNIFIYTRYFEETTIFIFSAKKQRKELHECNEAILNHKMFLNTYYIHKFELKLKIDKDCY